MDWRILTNEKLIQSVNREVPVDKLMREGYSIKQINEMRDQAAHEIIVEHRDNVNFYSIEFENRNLHGNEILVLVDYKLYKIPIVKLEQEAIRANILDSPNSRFGQNILFDNGHEFIFPLYLLRQERMFGVRRILSSKNMDIDRILMYPQM